MTNDDPAGWALLCVTCAIDHFQPYPGGPFQPVYGRPSQGEGYHDEAAASTREKK